MFATTTLSTDLTVVATWRSLMGGFVDANIRAFGWTYTPQTGDIDPSTAALPTAGTFAGFRIYKSNDVNANFYLRVDFGLGTYNSAAPMLKYQIGTTVNGSGVLGGQTSIAETLASQQSGGTARHYISGDASRLMVCLSGAGSSFADINNYVIFSLHRKVDVNGDGTDDGVELFQIGTFAGSTLSQDIPFSGTIPATESKWPCIFTAANPATVGGNNLYGIPQLFSGAGSNNNPTLAVAVTDAATLTVATTKQLTVYGQTRSYLVTNGIGVIAQNSTARAMLRYD